MSLIHLASDGQGSRPSHFTNQFPQGLCIPPNSEVALVGGCIRYMPQTGSVSFNGNTNRFVLYYGTPSVVETNQCRPITIQLDDRTVYDAREVSYQQLLEKLHLTQQSEKEEQLILMLPLYITVII